MENHKTKRVKGNKTDSEHTSPQGKGQQGCHSLPCREQWTQAVSDPPGGRYGQDTDTGMERTPRICPTELCAPEHRRREGDNGQQGMQDKSLHGEGIQGYFFEKRMIWNGGLKDKMT